MKKLVAALVIVGSLAGCADTAVVNGKHADTFGYLSLQKQRPDVCYKVSWGNVIWGALLFETIVAPVYFFGFSMYEPVGPKAGSETCDR